MSPNSVAFIYTPISASGKYQTQQQQCNINTIKSSSIRISTIRQQQQEQRQYQPISRVSCSKLYLSSRFDQQSSVESMSYLLHPHNSATFTSTFTTAATDMVIPSTTSTSFDPILPDISMLIGYSIVIILCIIAANVWSNDVVPISRTKLAIAKQQNSNSTLRNYLNELLEIENETANSKMNSVPTTIATTETTSIINPQQQEDVDLDDATEMNVMRQDSRNRNRRVFERWLFTDWLIKDSKVRQQYQIKKVGGRQKEPAIPIIIPQLKNAKWNSGDNPILVATTLILLGVIITSITERITYVLS